MCSILSHEKAVLWAVLSDPAHFRAVRPRVDAAHFGHAAYAKAFQVAEALYARGERISAARFDAEAARLGLGFSQAERKGLARLLRLPAPDRAGRHVEKLAQAVRDRAEGSPVRLVRFAV